MFSTDDLMNAAAEERRAEAAEAAAIDAAERRSRRIARLVDDYAAEYFRSDPENFLLAALDWAAGSAEHETLGDAITGSRPGSTEYCQALGDALWALLQSYAEHEARKEAEAHVRHFPREPRTEY